ncbi:MAG: hypothetical protein ABIG87_01090 [Patescibacteria group bacterium]
MNKKNITSSVFAALLLTALWFYIYQDLSDNQNNQAENVNNELVATSTSLINGVSLGLEGDNEVVIKTINEDLPQISQEEQQKPEIIKPVPDLDREIVFGDDFSEEAQQIMIDKMETTSQELKNDPTDFSNWLYLGLDRKAIGDYKGAKLAWEYAKLLDSYNFVVRGNLGDLYAYYLRDNKKAEENYLKALELDPSQVYLYYKTAEFYRDFLEDIQKAREIVQKGLDLSPNSAELQSLIESLK